ncbi:MAG: hypothetical protein CLLPBCKN_007135 [Chroococcidiopsis cubana SAG 39.79]|uniref:Uncharacterized protein n=1 Tax=Chroococcidiopsis cubana SAG 39.79 TaxID=388085 RepID=A0AB37UA81_9CYAN|nr:hypothetical protein [Chroococcidiopsis cubana SAG 39.79]RUT02671.1 hypothetical protein DSM107010_62110 [Chroococcidiopsis cubana SAG 39.79]
MCSPAGAKHRYPIRIQSDRAQLVEFDEKNARAFLKASQPVIPMWLDSGASAAGK